MKKKCCVIGLGYIGLPTSIIAASSGFEVIGVDKKTEVVEGLNKGIIHIVEPNLKESFQKIIDNKLFTAQTEPSIADVFLIAVPTPFKKKGDKIPSPDISYILEAVDAIIPYLREGNLLILESTSPVGTTDKIAEIIFQKTDFNPNTLNIAYCPERVLPGNILKEIISNDRVIGGINSRSAEYAKHFYSKFCLGKYNLTNTKTAELVKLTENSFRDVNIAFANELSMICSQLKINTQELIDIANCHPRVNILNPSPGVGGHCIAVDPWFIVSRFPKKATLIKTAREVNLKKTNWVINEINSAASSFLDINKKRPLIGCFGLTFKPDIDDIRESAAIKITKELIRQEHNIICCDPMIEFADGLILKSQNYLIKKCDICIFLVAHSKFTDINLKSKEVLDFCGITRR